MKKKPISQSPSQSTLISTPVTEPNPLDFPTAIREVIAGERLTKLSWKDPQTVVQLSNNRLQICLPKNDYTPCDLIISDGDLMGEDWVVV